MKANDMRFKLDDNSNEEFKDLNYRFSEANKLFQKFKNLEKSNTDEKELFLILRNIIDLVEINPIYNYYFLKYHKNIKEYSSFNEINNQDEKFTYQYNFQELKETLMPFDFYQLTNDSQTNPAIDIFNLMNLYLDDKKNNFLEQSCNIINYKFNCPLIESTERVRMLYYRSLFKKPENGEDERKKIKFKNICEGITSFRNLIKKMKNWIYSINLDENKFNKKFFVFMSNLEMINNFKSKDSKAIKKIYEKEFMPIKEFKSLNKKLNKESKGLLADFSSDDESELTTKIEILNKEEFRIYNKIESFKLKRDKYVLLNLIDDIKEFPDYPIKYILEKNQTFNEFFENNKNFINDEELFPEFKEYFLLFIKSDIVKEALHSSGKHENIIILLETDNFIETILNEKHIISLPLYNKVLEGYSNKDFLISGISGFPFIISGYGKINTLNEYNNLKNLAFIFNISMKLLICLHEILIHLAYGYLFHVSDGKISPKSPKSQKEYMYSNSPKDDGGSYFEELLFGERINKVSFNFIIRLLNGNFTNLSNFREELKKPIDLNDKTKQGKFLQKVLAKYKIDVNLFKTDAINGTIRGMFHEIAYYRENFYNDCS